MSLQSLSHVWNITGLTAEEKLVLLFIANNDASLGQPYCYEWISMSEFAGLSLEAALQVVFQIEEKGHLVIGERGEETAHCCWIAYDGPYYPPIDWTVETKGRKPRLAALLERDGPGCVYCGAIGVSYHLDHFIPRSRGGPDKLNNLVLACGPCNMAKAAQPPEQFLAARPDLLARIRIRLESPAE